jgi:2-C-methyl-D-erythritol 4-phosphate cytidylyltransferase
LNFINEDNAALFAAQIPQLEETSQVLAQLTLAARLGMQSIPEAAAASAMHKLVEVIQGLKSMKGELRQV